MTQPESPALPRRVIPLYAAETKVYPRSVTGRFANWRWLMVALTQLFFYGMPWLQWNGRQALLFDLEAGRFYVLGLLLYPQDFIYLAALLVLSALALFFFTAVAGRLWCGYSCPQTVYTEMFLWIERHTEGDRQARMRLDREPWSWPKIGRKCAKHGGWLALSLLTGFSFVAYFIPVRELAGQVLSLSLQAWPLFWVLFYAGATYGNAGFLREQMCKYICPYARFQSALIDADSLIISYDAQRGEPRGARSRKQELAPQTSGAADCVDCTLCVQVCPTGIDIRNGLQNECIGCAACIDVCDQVMDKVGAPRGLIRYATENGITGQWSRKQMLARVLRPRVLLYGAALMALSLAFVFSVYQREAILINVIKDRQVMARQVGEGEIENVYRLQLINRTERPLQLRLRADGLAGLRLLTQDAQSISVAPSSIGTLPVQLRLPLSAGLEAGAHPVQIEAQELGGGAKTFAAKAVFFVPR